MKKLLLLSSLLLGAIPASQAGVHFGIGIGLPLPFLPPIIIGRTRSVVVESAFPPVCEWGGPVVVAPPACYPYPYYYPPRHGYIVHRGGWERYGRYQGYRRY